MKTQTFKLGKTLVMRITVTGADIDRSMVREISIFGPGIARAATRENCKPLFETPDKTYELRVPCDDEPATGPDFQPAVALPEPPAPPPV
jgi:hypothetical protein